MIVKVDSGSATKVGVTVETEADDDELELDCTF